MKQPKGKEHENLDWLQQSANNAPERGPIALYSLVLKST